MVSEDPASESSWCSFALFFFFPVKIIFCISYGFVFSTIRFSSLSLIHLLKHFREIDKGTVTQPPKQLSMNYKDSLIGIDLLS